MYTRIKLYGTPQDIKSDESGVVAFVGTSETNETSKTGETGETEDIYCGERTDSTTNTDGATQTDTDTLTFRVIRLRPTFEKGVQPDPQTGNPKFEKRMVHCQYVAVSLEVPALDADATLEHTLQAIQDDFRAEMRSPLDSGQVNNDSALNELYETHFDNPSAPY